MVNFNDQHEQPGVNREFNVPVCAWIFLALIIYGNDTDYSTAFRDAGDDEILVDSENYMLKRSNQSFVVTFASGTCRNDQWVLPMVMVTCTHNHYVLPMVMLT